MGNQMSLWDIELPPQNEKKGAEKQENKISFARVQEKQNKPLFNRRVKVEDILKLVDKCAYRVSKHELLSDIFQCGAIAISNQFDKVQAAEREKVYLQIIKKYDKETQQLISKIFAEIYILLTQQIEYGFYDYLGEIYMRSETQSKGAGQFFTPYSVSLMCAEVAINETTVNEYIEQDKILTLHEPTCGAGGMIIAAVDILYNKYSFNYSRNLLVECGDIDARCVHMTYLQLACAGVPAVIYHRDGLTLQTWQRWETPAYIMQWLRFRDTEKIFYREGK